MARRTNFLDGNDNFREQNLRFVRNEMEDNFNQFFGGSNNNNGGNAGINNAPNVAAPPRDSKVVQPTPDIDIDPLMPAITKIELEQRRLFMREIGFSRSAAHSAAADSLQVPDFNMRGLQQRRVDMFLEQGSRNWVDVDAKIVREIRSLIESHQQRPKDRPGTQSSSSDINWIEDNIAGAVGSLSNARERDASPENYGLVRRTDENFHALQTRNSKRREEREIERKQLAERNKKFVGRQQQFDNLRRRNDRNNNNNNNHHRDFHDSNNQFVRRPKQNIDINNNNNCGFMNRNSNYVDFNQRNGNWDKENYYHGNFNQNFDTQNFNGCRNEYLNFYQDNNFRNQNFSDRRNEYSNYFQFNQSYDNFAQENNYHGNYNQNFGNQNFNGRYPYNFGNNNFHGYNNNIYDYRNDCNSYWADTLQANFEDNFQQNNWENFNENHYNFDFNGMLNNGGHLNFGNAFQFGNYGNQINWNNHQNNVNPPRAIRKAAINKKQKPQPTKQATDKKEVKKTTTDKKIEQIKQVIEQKGDEKKKIEQKKQGIEQKGEEKKKIERKKQVIEQKGEDKKKIEQKKQVIEQKGEQKKKQVIEQKGEQKKIEQKKQVIEQKGEQKKEIEQKKQVIEQKGEQKKEIEQKKQLIEQKGEQKKPSINNNKTEKKQSNVLPKPTTTAAKENVEKRTATEPLQSGKAKKQKYDGKKLGFIVAGVKLPYVKPNTQMPQPEEKSYAVTFFEHKPIYNTSIYAVDNDGDMDKYEDGYDTDNEFEIGGPTIRKRINNNWSRIYEERNYKCWLTWWKAFKWCELQINKKLKSFGSLNIKHKFLPYYKKQMSTQDVIINLMNRARFSLETKSNHFRDFKIIYELMNETFLENLLPATAEQLQHMIRKIPNHLWLYKMRRMVYIWAEYYKLSDNLTNDFAGLQMRWKSPAFHWLCKQAFDELKTLSTIEWPKHKEMYNKLKSVKS
ncbi:putative uncharacterized protein DDB_G0282133 isoform X1 [Drosophila albomicans]|uniref:Uncharacterized protein n=1 Tax=Drosophila albomicans TaxID=7291 RepID=A0A9C6SMY8_DROAB|nr:putative uncharacterized protein DDB_G0282133 isoform X1 [Drosophila albomicans]